MNEENINEGPRRARRRKNRAKKIGITVTIIVIIIVVLSGTAVGLIMNKLGKMQFDELDKNNLGINNELYNDVSENLSKKEFNSIKNVALFGIDGGRSDAIIIASINPADNSIKLISIPRDTYVKVEGHGKTKINHAYAYGKEQLALKTINSNFGLNISEYITINFKGLANVINKIGGIEMTISKEEMEYINKFVHESYALTGKNTQLLTSYGKIKLTGEQALTHASNRTVGSDFEREERQRKVLAAAMDKLSKKSITEIWNISDSLLEEVKTNINVTEYMGVVADVIGKKDDYLNNITSEQVPSTEMGKGQSIDGVYYFVCDLDEAGKTLKEIIYGK